ncbi:MAG: hybrid sensor histidine kinase/response regulator [Gemmatimonadaceae bacterium]
MASSAPPHRRKNAREGIVGLRRYSAWFAMALIALAVAELALFVGQRVVQSWQDHSRHVAMLARDTYALALDRNAAVSAYLVDRAAEQAAMAHADGARLDSSLDALAALTADNAHQHARVIAMATAVRAWNQAFVVPALAGSIAVPRAPGVAAEAFGRVRAAFATFLTAEDVLYDNRRRGDLVLGIVALAAMLVPAGLLAGLVVASGRRFAGQADLLGDQQDQLEEQAVELEQQVQELETTNTELAEAAEAERDARAQMEQEMRERRRNAALLDAAMTSSPIGLSLLDRDLRYVRVNDAIARITGIAPDAHVGRTLRDVNPQLSEDIEAALRRVVETDEPLRNLEMTRASGSSGGPRHLLLNVYPVKTADGESLGLGVAALDTTDQRELLAQFHHAQKLEAVGRLAAGVAHDFNNLLTVIRSYCDLALLEMPLGAPGREEIGEIRTAGDRAASLSRRMLTFSRKQVVLPRALDVGDTVREMESMLRQVTGETVGLDLKLDAPLGIVLLDPTQLEQILMNLVINAVDAMPAGGQIVVEASNRSVSEPEAKRHVGLEAGDYVVVGVRDNGTGIDDDTLPRIFDPFFTTKLPGKGTGLGLSTVYGIVQSAGGHVRVDSVLGAGTTFRVYLRAEPPRVAPLLPHADGPSAAGAQAIARDGETVLVVEDEDALRDTLKRILRRRGYHVLEASHGGEALRVAQASDTRIDLVLSDIHMPGMHGQELVERLHMDRPDLKVLFTSGSSAGGDGEGRAMTGPFAFIAKPFSITDLALAVRHALDAPNPG